MPTSHSLPRRRCQASIWAAFALVLTTCAAGPRAMAQNDNPVYVDDSPQAWELFRQAGDQSRDNAGEAVRLYQELLDEFGVKLIRAVEGSPDLLRSVRSRVIRQLVESPALLERYRTMQTPRADELLQAGELERLALTRSLTAPGLEALLRLAQRDLEQARFRSALHWLDQAMTHPDLAGRRAAHGFHMSGLAGVHLGDLALVDEALRELEALGAESEPFLKSLQRAIGQPAAPATLVGQTILDVGRAADLHDLVPQAIWSSPLNDSLLKRRTAVAQDDPQSAGALIEQRLAGAELNTVAVTAVGQMLVVNQGHTVQAINRLTGREMWSFTDPGRAGQVERDGVDPLDLNIAAVDQGVVVTLTGHATSGARPDGGRLIALDAETGSPRWSLNVSSLVDSVGGDGLYPHGAPVIADGTAYVMARRAGGQLLTSAYLVAIDVESGTVRWVRFIASSGGLRSSPRSFCSVVHHEGSLYVSSALGAAARIEPTTGELVWLRRFNVPINAPIIDQGRRPWEMTAPVITTRGLVTVQPDQRRIAVLDLETGDQIESHPSATASDWNSPRYLLANDQFVYGVGSEIRAFRLEDLSTPSWRLPVVALQESSPPDQDGRSGPDRRADSPQIPPSLEIRGRVQLLEDSLIVPTAEGLLVVDHETGVVEHRLPVQPPGNPLAVESQVVLAAGDRVESYMSLNRAERMLRDQIVQSPTEPEPALSLLRLGLRVRNLELSLEAAQLALAAIGRLSEADPGNLRAADRRDELFAGLLEAANAELAVTAEQGERLFGVINSVAIDSTQRAEYLLAYGQWLSGSRLDKAVETWQTLLSDRLLAETWREERGVSRPASAWAADRLAALIAQRGATVYAPQADYAAMRLRQLTQVADPMSIDPEALTSLAREFPFADAAIEASRQAASIHRGRGAVRPALAALLAVYNLAPTPANASRLFGDFVEICVQGGWDSLALAALRHVAQQHGDVELITTAGPRLAADWLAELLAANNTSALPAIGIAASDARRLDGEMVEPVHGPTRLPLDRVLVRSGETVRLLSAANLEPLWTTTVTGQLPELLRYEDPDILLWLHTDPQNPKAVMLDAATGQARWTTPRLGDLLGDPLEAGRVRGVREQMPDGELFDHSEVLPLLSGDALTLVQRTGGAAAFSVENGDVARWTRKQTLEQVHLAAAHPAAIVLAGMVRSVDAGGQGALEPRIMLLDPRSGDSLTPADASLELAGRSGVKWMTISPLGRIVCGSADGIDVFDLFTGRRVLSTAEYVTLDSQRAWQLHDTLVYEDHRSRLRTFNPASGAISEPFEMPLRGEWDPLELRDLRLAGDRLVAHYPQRIVFYDPATGAVIGSDMVAEDRDYRWMLVAADRLLAISGRTEQAPMNEQGGRRTQYAYHVFAFSENGKVLDNPLAIEPLPERVQHAALINGWLLLSTNDDTLALPMPATGP